MLNNSHLDRYDAIAVLLHWVMAIAFICMLASGIILEEWETIPQELKFNMFQWHKSLGVILIVMVVVRIGWRIIRPSPKFPQSFKKRDILAAKLGHFLLYGLMVAMPLSGWVMVSSSVYGLPTIVFGLFAWPHIPNIQANEIINDFAKEGHEVLGTAFIILILAHIAAVLKHALVDKENLLTRMTFKGKK